MGRREGNEVRRVTKATVLEEGPDGGLLRLALTLAGRSEVCTTNLYFELRIKNLIRAFFLNLVCRGYRRHFAGQ